MPRHLDHDPAADAPNRQRAMAPVDPEHALHVAAEHFAFCPDNVWQATGDLTGCADTLIDRTSWSFWWA